MQINDLFGRAAAFETARLPDGTAAVLPAEHAAALYVNEQPAFRVVCTPELLPRAGCSGGTAAPGGGDPAAGKSLRPYCCKGAVRPDGPAPL